MLALSDQLVAELERGGYRVISPRGEGEESGIVSFVSDRHPSKELFGRLTEAGVVVSLREGAVRASPTFYNDETDVERLLAALPR